MDPVILVLCTNLQALALEDLVVAHLSVEDTPLHHFANSLEQEWIYTRQQRILDECRRTLEQPSGEGVQYDVSCDDGGAFDILGQVGDVDEREGGVLEKMLRFDPCKVSSHYHALVLLMHSAVKEAIQLEE